MPFEIKDITWNSKTGWSVPRHVIYRMTMFIGFFCSLTLHDREYRSGVYFVMETGESLFVYIQKDIYLMNHLQNILDFTQLSISECERFWTSLGIGRWLAYYSPFRWSRRTLALTSAYMIFKR